MGRNKEIRKKIEGHRRMILEHRDKVAGELQSPHPRLHFVAYWQKRIHQVELEILYVEEKLHRR